MICHAEMSIRSQLLQGMFEVINHHPAMNEEAAPSSMWWLSHNHDK